jgi:hypothetical protein
MLRLPGVLLQQELILVVPLHAALYFRSVGWLLLAVLV